ncbi:MAG: LTA synthase family protein [Deltaproteobacteria bacterium]|nr:LTA synthase family protein [Deltaproteobacteria bacterium]
MHPDPSQPRPARLRAFLPPSLAILCGIYLLSDLVLTGVEQYKHEFALGDWSVLGALLAKLAFDLCLFGAITGLLIKALPTRLPAVAFVAFAVLLHCVDAALYLYGNTLFERGQLDLIETYSLEGWLGPPLYGLLAGWLGTIAAAWWLVPRVARTLRWRGLALWALALALSTGASLGLTRVVYEIEGPEELDTHLRQFRGEQLAYVTRSSLINALRELSRRGSGEGFRRLDSITPYRPVIEAQGLGLGAGRPPELGLAPFRRVILFTVESLSLELIQAHNPRLPIEPFPFLLGRPEIVARTYRNVRTTAAPTLEGLSVTLTSHPNFGRQRDASDYQRQDREQRPLYHQLALPWLLRRAGFETIFLRSASKYYAHENIIFQDMGYQEVIGREDFHADPELHPHVQGWGLRDRLLYDELVELLEARRDEKVFVTVLGVDTHPPAGRGDYGALDYPALERVQLARLQPRSRGFVTSMYRKDHDLARVLRALEDRGLLDEETLVVITADHASPLTPAVTHLPGYERTALARVPLLFLSGQALPAPPVDERGSQLDIAPTLVHLLGLERPVGWWGQSLLDPARRGTVIGFHRDRLRIEGPAARLVVDTEHPAPEQAELIELFEGILLPR